MGSVVRRCFIDEIHARIPEAVLVGMSSVGSRALLTTEAAAGWLPAGCWALKAPHPGERGRAVGGDRVPSISAASCERASGPPVIFLPSGHGPLPLAGRQERPWRGPLLPSPAAETTTMPPSPPGFCVPFLFGFTIDGILCWSQIFALFPDRSIFVCAFLVSLKRIGWWGLSPGCIDS